MRKFAWICVIVAAITASALGAQAKDGAIEVKVSYRERIALPPDAQLDVLLLDMSRGGAMATRIASQRFAMTGVPMTVTLGYDPRIVEKTARYALTATIWSGDRKVFALQSPQDISLGFEGGPVDIMLGMVVEDGASRAPLEPIKGIAWRVTEVLGEIWNGSDPATLLIDENLNFSIFGGCNRFNGQLSLVDKDISFPSDFAGTLMACPDDVEALERKFLAALRGVDHHVRYGKGLILTDANGDALMHFEHDPR